MGYLSVEDLAKTMGISRTKAYELAHQEGFPAIRVTSRRIVIREEMLNQWFEDQVNKKNTQGGF